MTRPYSFPLSEAEKLIAVKGNAPNRRLAPPTPEALAQFIDEVVNQFLEQNPLRRPRRPLFQRLQSHRKLERHAQSLLDRLTDSSEIRQELASAARLQVYDGTKGVQSAIEAIENVVRWARWSIQMMEHKDYELDVRENTRTKDLEDFLLLGLAQIWTVHVLDLPLDGGDEPPTSEFIDFAFPIYKTIPGQKKTTKEAIRSRFNRVFETAAR